MPALDLRAEPEHWPAAAEVDYGAGHVGVARLVLADGVPVGYPKNARDVVGVDEVVNDDSARHMKSLRPSLDRGDTGKQFCPTSDVLLRSNRKAAPAVLAHPEAWPRPD